MSCTDKDIVKKLKETPALLFAGVKTPLGFLLYIFFLIISFAGLKYLSGKNNIFQFIKTQITNLGESSKDQFNKTRRKTEGYVKNSYKILFFVITITTFLLTFLFATGEIYWIAIFLAVIISFLGITTFLYYFNNENEVRTRLISTVSAGVVIGLGLSIIGLLIRWASSWFSGDFIIDLFFIFTITYAVIASFILIPIGTKQISNKLKIKNNSK